MKHRFFRTCAPPTVAASRDKVINATDPLRANDSNSNSPIFAASHAT